MEDILKKQFIEKALKVHSDKYDYSKVNYINAKTKVCIICKKHGEFWQTPSGHLSGRGCPVCRYINSAKKNSLTQEDFIEKAISVHGNKYDYSKVQYINNRTKVCIICPKHGEFWQMPTKHIDAKHGCPYCTNHFTRTNEQFIKDATSVHGNKFDYSKVEYIASHKKVCIICPKHGEFWQTPHDHLQGNGCPSCNASKIEIEIEKILTEFNIKYIREYNEKTLGKQELDFFIPTCKLVIECQGVQHFKPVRFGGRDDKKSYESFLHTIELDSRKKKICDQLGFKIIYYTKRKNTVRGYKTNKLFKGIYTNKNIFFDKTKILTKIIEELG